MECVARKGAIRKPSPAGTIEESGNARGDEIMNSREAQEGRIATSFWVNLTR